MGVVVDVEGAERWLDEYEWTDGTVREYYLGGRAILESMGLDVVQLDTGQHRILGHGDTGDAARGLDELKPSRGLFVAAACSTTTVGLAAAWTRYAGGCAILESMGLDVVQLDTGQHRILGHGEEAGQA